MRMPYAAAIVLLAGLTACSSNRGESAGASDTTGAAAATAPTTGPGSSMSGNSVMSEAQVQQNLRDHGFSNVANLRRAGDDWVGTASDSDGRPVNFDMNPTGIIVVMP